MIAHDFVPTNADELKACLADPMWRICSGALYKIMVKTDTGEGTVVPFRPNEAQRQFISRLWNRNLILKARQLGFTTLVSVLFLDHAQFNADQRCGIIAQDREAAEAIFRDKVKLAYERQPGFLKSKFPLARDSASELLFAHNNSSIRVATSMRSGTIHRLHISEFGKICAKYPDKAAEIVTGSLPAVPLDGITIIESTAEGRDGEYYAMSQRAMAAHESKKQLTERDYRFHFYPWHGEKNYRISGDVIITEKDSEYFDNLEKSLGILLDTEQRAWYVATRDADFSGDPEKMWQEYPSTPSEAFQVSTEGTYYAAQLSAARKSNRITRVPHTDGIKVNTYWDIGGGDGTGIWLEQKIGQAHHFIKYIEGWDRPYSYFIGELQKLGYVWGTHFLPHDAGHKRQQGTAMAAPIDMLKKLSIGGEWRVLPRVDEIQHGIQLVRSYFNQCSFDEEGCKEGLIHLGAYRKTWSERGQCWSDTPKHDVHSECADAFRQWAQAKEKGFDLYDDGANYAPLPQYDSPLGISWG